MGDWQAYADDATAFAAKREEFDPKAMYCSSRFSTLTMLYRHPRRTCALSCRRYRRPQRFRRPENQPRLRDARQGADIRRPRLPQLALAFAEADLGRECLLSACLAINIHPGETVQPWHYDDGHYRLPRPRQSLGVSAFWAIDETTEVNGATEIIPGSHVWPEHELPGSSNTLTSFADQQDSRRRATIPGARSDSIKVTMKPGSLMLAKGTLWHRGGANRSDRSRMIITPQYCPGWTRQLENMASRGAASDCRNVARAGAAN